MLKELNQVMEYIEEHLEEELSLEEIASFAGVSDFHFRKIFFYLSGISLSEYVKHRRLSEAGMDLLQGESVTDVAFKYGYQSLDGFSRAFKKWSGLLPSEVLKQGSCKSFAKFSFVINIQGGETMDYRIEHMPAFYFAGVSRRGPMQFEGINQEIVKLAECITEDQRKEMHRLKDMTPSEIVNVSYEADAKFLKEEGELTHLIGVLSTDGSKSDLLEKVYVESYTWAVFPNEGPFPSTLQKTMANIFAQWLPSSNYEVIQAPNFSFTRLNPQNQEYAYCEIWIPMKERS